MTMSLKELELETISQLGALRAIAEHGGHTLTHANFHGALGNLSFVDADVARTLILAMKSFDPELRFIGLPHIEAVYAAEKAGIQVIRSFLADQGYMAAGKLSPRKTESALISELEVVESRVAQTLSSGRLRLTETPLPPVPYVVMYRGDRPHTFVHEIAELVKVHCDFGKNYQI